jgi:hypothetical protein
MSGNDSKQESSFRGNRQGYPYFNVPLFADGETFLYQIQNVLFLFWELIALIILVKEEPPTPVSPGVHHMVKTDPRRHFQPFDRHAQLFQALMA